MTALKAQFLIQSNHAPVIGDIIKTRQCDSTSINPGPSGSGVVWTFTNMTIHTPTVTSTVTAVSSSTSAASYPSASLAITPDNSNYSFYSVSTNSNTTYNYWGGNIVVQSFNITMNYTQPAVLASYPVAYNSTYSVNASGTLQYGPLNGTFSGVASYTADGTGSLQLPATGTLTVKSFSNVLRVKTVQLLTFSALVTGTLTQITYDYYAPLVTKSPILSITSSTIHTTSSSDNTQTIVTVNSDYQTMGVNDLSKEIPELAVYPNPASSFLTIGFDNANGESASYEIINALGQRVRAAELEHSTGAVKQQVSLEGLEAGMYFVKVRLGEKTGTEKITIR